MRPAGNQSNIQRRASNTGVIMVVGQKIALGRTHKYQTVTVLVSDRNGIMAAFPRSLGTERMGRTRARGGPDHVRCN
jgi:hypothetical protein